MKAQKWLQSFNKQSEKDVNPWMGREFPMSNVSAITGISRVTRPVSSDTQIGLLQRRLEALDKQRASAASSNDETATYRLQALTQQMGLLQTQIGQLQQAANAAAQQAGVPEPEEDDSEIAEDTSELGEPSDMPTTTRRASPPPEERPTNVAQEARNAQRDAAAVARNRAEGSLVGSNVDTYA